MRNKMRFSGPNAKGWEALYERKAKMRRAEIVDFFEENILKIAVAVLVLVFIMLYIVGQVFGPVLAVLLLLPLIATIAIFATIFYVGL